MRRSSRWPDRSPIVILADTSIFLFVVAATFVVLAIDALVQLLDDGSWWWAAVLLAKALLAWWAFDLARENRQLRNAVETRMPDRPTEGR